MKGIRDVVQSSNPSTQEAEVGRSLESSSSTTTLLTKKVLFHKKSGQSSFPVVLIFLKYSALQTLNMEHVIVFSEFFLKTACVFQICVDLSPSR